MKKVLWFILYLSFIFIDSYCQIQVGISKVSITPQIELVDSNKQNGETYFHDLNNNGRHDKYWLAGFPWLREAKDINDSLWARAIVWDDGNQRICMVSLDLTSIFFEDVQSIREMTLQSIPSLNHIIISTTHTHSAPDLLGINGPKKEVRGVNESYLLLVKNKTVQAINIACNNLKPVNIKVSQINVTESELVVDKRPPYVLDSTLTIIAIEEVKDNVPIGLFMNWSNHPHCFGENTISSDFYHYWRTGIENGIIYDDITEMNGIGGIAVCFNGAVGGHIVVGKKVHDPWLNKYCTNAKDEARAVGYRLAEKVLKQYENKDDWETLENTKLSVGSSVFEIEVSNPKFLYLDKMGIIKKDDFQKEGKNYVLTEIDLISIGNICFLTIPGEIFPEIIIGGVESPNNADFSGEPIEKTPIRDIMPGKYNFIIGMANDMIGYIIPKTQWDEKPPFTYGLQKRPSHEEGVSMGPNTSELIYLECKKLIEQQ